MGASSLMTLGVRAMAANYAALQVTGHNIANASVPGYSRQRAELATASGQFSGAGYFGKGADVQTIVRTHDAFLTREARVTASLARMDEARLAQLRQLEAVFPTGERGLGHAASLLANALADLANRPDDLSAREVVLARARDLAARFASADTQLATLQQGTREELRASVATVNQLTRNLAELNQQIAAVKGLGQPPNDLLDRRDQLLAELSQHIGITTVAADDGTVGVFAGGGQRLVLGNESQPLAVVDDPQDASRAAIAVMDNGIPLRLRESVLGGGRIAGLLHFQNEDLVQAQLQLGQMAVGITGAYNAQHREGLTLDGEPGGDLFSMPGVPMARAASGMRVMLSDPRALAAAQAPPAASNANALALAALRDAPVVGGSSATDAYAALLADVGVRVQSSQASAELSHALATHAEQSRSAGAGVNLDEEAARLIEFQQSYQAAARVLQVAQSIFDTLLQVTRG